MIIRIRVALRAASPSTKELSKQNDFVDGGGMMHNVWIDRKSFIAGIKAMKWKHEKVNYKLEFSWKHRGFWIHLWTPKWHRDRGPYISIGLYVIRFIRGY